MDNHEKIHAVLAMWIRRAREGSAFPFALFANEMSVSRATLEAWECGREAPRIEQIRSMIERFRFVDPLAEELVALRFCIDDNVDEADWRLAERAVRIYDSQGMATIGPEPPVGAHSGLSAADKRLIDRWKGGGGAYLRSSIFVSYRRSDTASIARHIRDCLTSRYGTGDVFMDIDIRPSVNFVDAIRSAIRDCNIM
jgi:hypothetical protein